MILTTNNKTNLMKEDRHNTESSDRSDSDCEPTTQDSYTLKQEQCAKIYEQILVGTNLSQLRQQLANFNRFDMLSSSC